MTSRVGFFTSPFPPLPFSSVIVVIQSAGGEDILFYCKLALSLHSNSSSSFHPECSCLHLIGCINGMTNNSSSRLHLLFAETHTQRTTTSSSRGRNNSHIYPTMQCIHSSSSSGSTIDSECQQSYNGESLSIIIIILF